MVKKIGHQLIRIFQRLLWVFPINTHKVFIVSYYGQGYGGNGKYIAEALKEISPKFTIYWPVRENVDTSSFPESIKVIHYYSLPFFYHLATSGTWISNVRLPWFFEKRKKQYYIQAWHGSNALKRVEMDAEDAIAPRYLKSAKHDAEISDLMISNSDSWTKLIRRSFWYDGEILECGTPRLKAIYEDRQINRFNILKQLGLEEDINILLYAPTFRADFGLEHYTLDFDEVRKNCEKKFGGKWVTAIRLHPNLKGEDITDLTGEDVLDLSDYPDIYKILSATRMLITDYSGVMFEACAIGIDVILYADDIEDYTSDRGFYFDLKELPFPLAETNEQLIQIIKEWDEEAYRRGVKKLIDDIGLKEDGKGAEAVARKIISHWDNN